jgi:toxin YoeB
MKNKKSSNKPQAKSAAILWTDGARNKYLSWQAEDPKIVSEINKLIEECKRNPFKGTSKLENGVEVLPILYRKSVKAFQNIFYVY